MKTVLDWLILLAIVGIVAAGIGSRFADFDAGMFNHLSETLIGVSK